jgi:alkyl sulfatase BDS1-like metallo-beta-lactamase superfamily hydrolase
MPLRARRGDHLDGPLNVLTDLIGLLDEPDPTFAIITP